MLSFWEILKSVDTPPSPPLEGGISPEKNALYELELEEKYKDYKKILEFRELILELNSELGLY
jgi:hypothetical protein